MFSEGGHIGTDAGGPLTVGFKTESRADETQSKMSKADMRRIARKKREEQWVAYLATKPSDDEECQVDVEAIQEAERTMGDFKLKMDSNYIVPEVSSESVFQRI